MVSDGTRQRTRRERTVWRIGLLLSVLLHLIVILIFQTRQERLTPYAAAGPRSGDAVAAPGGGGMRSVVLRPPEEITIPPRPEVPVVKPMEVQEPEQPVLALSELVLPELGQGKKEGAQSGSGLPGGEGGGDAGTAMTGLRRLTPPTPRYTIWGTPLRYRTESVRGRDVTVWVFVNEAGAVDSVRLEPPTPDRRFNERLMRDARDWVFDPAKRAGRPVATWYSYSWKL